MPESTHAEKLVPEVRLVLGRSIRRRRIELGLTQKQLGALVDLNESSVSTIERGVRGSNPTLRTMLLLMRALEAESLDELVGPVATDQLSELQWAARPKPTPTRRRR